MTRRRWAHALAVTLLTLCASAAGAASPDHPATQREIIPGSELMTHQERERYRRRMRGARNADEQYQLREQHVQRMRERARLRGLDLHEPAVADSK